MASASRRAQIGDAVVQALSAVSEEELIAAEFVAGRKYITLLTLSDLAKQGFTATVFIGDEKRALYTRGQSRKDLEINVGLELKLQPTTQPASTNPDNYTEIDNAMAVAEQVAALFEPFAVSYPGQQIAQNLLNAAGAKWISSLIPKATYSVGNMREENTFVAAVIFTFAYL